MAVSLARDPGPANFRGARVHDETRPAPKTMLGTPRAFRGWLHSTKQILRTVEQ